jgi:6,7-dimethyl-8-ribityllumazine synthase
MPVVNVQNIPHLFNIAIVVSRHHYDVTQKLLEGTLERLQELGFSKEHITVLWVPTVVEIPITAQRLAKGEKSQAIICLGSVIAGETHHFEYICSQVSSGCQQVALSQDIPVIFGVLTTDTLSQAQERAGGNKGHIGRQSADAAFEVVSVLRQI